MKESAIVKKWAYTFMIFIISFALSSSLTAESTDDMIGEKAPIISGKQAIGKGLINLRELMIELSFKKDKEGNFVEVDGKYVPQLTKNVVVLNFFSTSCIPCIKEIPTYNKLAKKYEKLPVKMIYVNIDAEVSSMEMARFIARKQIKVPMMLPNQREAIRKYKAYTLPRMVVIDREGKIVEIIKGFNENLEEELSGLIDELLG